MRNPPRTSTRLVRQGRVSGLPIGVVVSIALHAAALVAVVGYLRPGMLPSPDADKAAQIEMVMVERQGVGKTTPEQAPNHDADMAPPEPAPEVKEAAQPAAAPQDPDNSPAPVVASAQPAQSLPVPPVPPAPDLSRAQAEPAPPRTEVTPPDVESAAPPAPALTMNLGGTDSDTNAIVTGDSIIPAKLDSRTRNRPPVYPFEAARHGQQGNVVVMIHVSPQGFTAGADVVKSSGYAVLDDAARDAVMTWRFIPAVKDGMPVSFDMAMDFRFELN